MGRPPPLPNPPSIEPPVVTDGAGPPLVLRARELHSVGRTIAGDARRPRPHQASSKIDIVADLSDLQWAVTLPAAEGATLRVVMRSRRVRYYLHRGGEVVEMPPREVRLDRGVYLLLAELAAA